MTDTATATYDPTDGLELDGAEWILDALPTVAQQMCNALIRADVITPSEEWSARAHDRALGAAWTLTFTGDNADGELSVRVGMDTGSTVDMADALVLLTAALLTDVEED